MFMGRANMFIDCTPAYTSPELPQPVAVAIIHPTVFTNIITSICYCNQTAIIAVQNSTLSPLHLVLH